MAPHPIIFLQGPHFTPVHYSGTPHYPKFHYLGPHTSSFPQGTSPHSNLTTGTPPTFTTQGLHPSHPIPSSEDPSPDLTTQGSRTLHPRPARPTHSEAPSLVGDGPSAMAGLMVSAGSTGFLRASIGAPRAGGGASSRGP